METRPKNTRRILRWAPLLGLVLAACSSGGERPCDLRVGEDETWVVVCPDGTSGAFFPAPEGETLGTISGVARLLAVEDSSGITVTLFPSGDDGSIRTTVTDREGRFEFADVEPRIYDITFRYPGYTSAARRQRPVLPGVLALPPLTLRPSIRIAAKDASILVPAPTHDAFFFQPELGDELLLWESAASDVIHISQRAGAARWLADGSGFLFLDGYENGIGSLLWYDRARRRAEPIALNVRDWHVSEDLQAITIEHPQGRLSTWHEGKLEAVLASGTNSWFVSPDGKAVVALFLVRETSKLNVLLWDIPSATGSVLAVHEQGSVDFAEEGGSFVFKAADGPTLWDGRRETLVPFPAHDEAYISPDGELVILEGGAVNLAAYEVRSGRSVSLVGPGSRVDWWAFDPHTSAPFFITTDSRTRLATFERGEVVTIDEMPPSSGPFGRFTFPLFPSGFDGIVYTTYESAGEALKVWERRQKLREVATELKAGPLLLEGGTHLLFETERPQLLDLSTQETAELWQDGIVSHVGSHAAGLMHFPILPYYRNSPPLGEWVGPIGIYDFIEGTQHVVADEIWHQSCRFGENAGLLCLSRRSPLAPRGARLLHWDTKRAQFVSLVDGALSFRWSPVDDRMAILSQPTLDSGSPLLSLYDPSFSAPVPVDDGVNLVIMGDGWIAYTIPEGARRGVHVSTYPDPPREGEHHE